MREVSRNKERLWLRSIEELSTKPGDLALCTVRWAKLPKAVAGRVNETKLATLRNIDRTKNMISPVKQQPRVSFESELTFAPKLNAMSIKLAKERGVKEGEISVRTQEGSAVRRGRVELYISSKSQQQQCENYAEFEDYVLRSPAAACRKKTKAICE